MGLSFLTGDAENVFWQVLIQEETYLRQLDKGVTCPENVVWKPKKEWYGRRIAGQAFVEWTAGHLKELWLKCALTTSSLLDPTSHWLALRKNCVDESTSRGPEWHGTPCADGGIDDGAADC